MKIGELRQRCGLCQITDRCGRSGTCLCCDPVLAGTDEQDYIRNTEAARERLRSGYMEHTAGRRPPAAGMQAAE